MRLFTTPHAKMRGAQLRVSGIGLACYVALLAALPAGVAGQPAQAGGSTTATAAAGQTRADPQQVAMARALFEEGLRHVDAEQWSLAADRFARVLALRYSAVAAYNLALAQARLGQSMSALEGLRGLLAQPSLEANVRDVALALQKQVNADVGWLTVQVRGECEACRVELDAKELPAAALNVAIPVDPGPHALGLLQAERALATRNLNMAKGARLVVRLESPASRTLAAASIESAGEPAAVSGAGFAAAPSSALKDSPPPRDSGPSLFKSPWFWAGVGVLAVGAVTLGVVLASGGTQTEPAVPGDFTPRVLAGQVSP